MRWILLTDSLLALYYDSGRKYTVLYCLTPQIATPTFGDTAGAMVVLDSCVVSQGDTGQ